MDQSTVNLLPLLNTFSLHIFHRGHFQMSLCYVRKLMSNFTQPQLSTQAKKNIFQDANGGNNAHCFKVCIAYVVHSKCNRFPLCQIK